MAGWWEILVAAFSLQLAVLPGEKVQFIIAGLSTRYHPLLVVGAAGTAFAGWTTVEIVFGRTIQRILSPVLLDAFTGVLFLLFGYLLVRSAPAPGESMAMLEEEASKADDTGILSAETPDVEIFGWHVPNRLGGFLPIFALMAAGEFGDKTQLVTIGLAAQYGARPAIWAGEMLAIIPVSIINAYFFHRFAGRFDSRKAHFGSAALFFFFGFDTFLALTTGVSIWERIVNVVADIVLALG